MKIESKKKIIITKASVAYKSQPSPRRPSPAYQSPQNSTTGVWVVLVIVILVATGVVGAGFVKYQSRKRVIQRPSTTFAPPPKEEHFWMGEYMRKHGSPEELRARQERIRQHDSRRDTVNSQPKN